LNSLEDRLVAAKQDVEAKVREIEKTMTEYLMSTTLLACLKQKAESMPNASYQETITALQQEAVAFYGHGPNHSFFVEFSRS